MIGEIALYSFIVLLLTGIYLSLFFHASSTDVVYNGSFVPLKGVTMSDAYASTVALSFDVRGGLIMRQMHHWAALLFMAAIVIHLLRVFFTGAYRKPREVNWVIGCLLLIMGILEGFAGYSLPDDLLSGVGLRIAASIMQAIPVVGTYVEFFLFNGQFPGHGFIERLYAVHILLLPGAILGLISAHMGILWHQKHTQFPGPGRTEHNVVGERFFPYYVAKAGGFFFIVFGMLALLGGLAQINPIWSYGAYTPANVSAGSQPDWYMGWLDGSTRLMPDWEIHLYGHTLAPIFWAAIVMPGLVFNLLIAWPWIEQKLTGDKSSHELLQRPRDNAWRTAIGAMSVSFYLVLVLSGANDIFARIFGVSLNATTYVGRIGLFVVPPLVFKITKSICLALQRRDKDNLEHGFETGIVRMTASGEFYEVHAPMPAQHEPHLVLVDGGEIPFALLPEVVATPGALQVREAELVGQPEAPPVD